jgi:hypothetical protein
MVAPTKGPYTKKFGSDSVGSPFFKQRTWSTQAKPFTLALPFHFYEGRTVNDLPAGRLGYNPATYGVDPANLPAPMNVNSVNNRCRDKLYGKLGESVDMATNLAERRQAVQMIASRCGQILRAFRAVRKGRFKEASRVLGLDNTPKRVSAKKQVSNNWLEYHFGWSPLLSDIHGAVDVLQGPSEKRTIRARASASTYITSTGGYPNTPPYGSNATRDWYDYSVRSGLRFTISNPDLWLANRLGLINPATVAWELVPFSFVVDWFVPIGNFIGGMTATLGLSITDGWTSYRTFHQNHDIKLFNLGTLPYPRGSYFGWGVIADRRIGALSATPTFTPTMSFSPIRAFTAVTLLIQQMKGR